MFFIPERFEAFDKSFNQFCTSIVVIAIFLHLRNQLKYTTNWLRVDVIFLVGYLIVHFQIPFLESINIHPENPNFIWLNKRVVNYATWMSSISLILWLIGYSLFKSKRKKNVIQNKIPTKIRVYQRFDIFLLGIYLIFLGLVGPSLFSGVYDGGSSWGTGSNYVYLILRVLLYLRIIYFFRDFQKFTPYKLIIKKLITQKIFLAILLSFVFLFLMSGDRGPIMQIALITAGSYSLFIRIISLKQLLVCLIGGAFIFTIISFGRGRDASKLGDGNIFERGYENYSKSEDSRNFTHELATSVRIQYRALDVVPNKHPYLYGITFATVGFGTIPFVGSLIIDTFDIPKQYTSSSSFFTYLGQGNNPRYGEGSEILSDIYVNFGLLGTFICMFLFGIFSKKIFIEATRLNLNFVIIFLGILISAITMNRGMLLTPLKDVAYLLFFNYIYSKLRNAK